MPFKDKRFAFNTSSKQKKDKQRKAMFANINKNRTSSRRKRARVEFQGKGKHPKRHNNNVRTVSNSDNVKVLDSWDEKESRRKYQNNIVYIEDEDSNIQMTVVDRQNSLKPKKARYITAQEIQGDYVITEYDSKKRKVAELHVQPSNIEPLDTTRSETQTQKRIKEFKEDIKNSKLTDHQVANQYEKTFIRNIAKDEYQLKRDSGIKNESLNLVRKIRKIKKTKSKHKEPESPKFGDITKIKR